MTRPLSDVQSAELRVRAARTLSTMPRPFVRWAGSKRGLLAEIVPHLPRRFGTYYEPFLGGGALFFLIQPERAVLNDTCSELIDAYHAVRTDAERVAKAAVKLPLTKDNFYLIRANRSRDRWEKAGEFIFLNKGCFNGLYRVNSQGEFNVPWGRPRTGNVVDHQNLIAAQKVLSQSAIRLTCEDFEVSVNSCRKGDLVYFDPPYVTRHNNNGFVDYNEKLFSWQDQVRLATVAEDLRRRGCFVMVTNAMHDDIVTLYKNFRVYELIRHSTLASSREKRGKVSEALFVS